MQSYVLASPSMMGRCEAWSVIGMVECNKEEFASHLFYFGLQPCLGGLGFIGGNQYPWSLEYDRDQAFRKENSGAMCSRGGWRGLATFLSDECFRPMPHGNWFDQQIPHMRPDVNSSSESLLCLSLYLKSLSCFLGPLSITSLFALCCFNPECPPVGLHSQTDKIKTR